MALKIKHLLGLREVPASDIRQIFKTAESFLEILERTFAKERRYEFRYGAKTFDGLKSCQEITIAKISVQNLADYCIGNDDKFQI